MAWLISAPPPAVAPTTLFRSRIVFGRAMPLHVGVALDQLAEAPVSNGGGEKLDRFIETMLADNTKQDSGLIGDFDHAPRRLERGRNRLLHLNVPAGLGTRLNRLQSEIRERYRRRRSPGPDADTRPRNDRETRRRSTRRIGVHARFGGQCRHGSGSRDFGTARMKRRNCARAYEADSHVTVPSCQVASCQLPVTSHQFPGQSLTTIT